MNKPEGIPQDVWDATCAIDIDADFSWDGQVNGTSAYIDARTGIARAILAAEQREREACAQVAELAPEGAVFERAAMMISIAIRKRGEPL